MMFGKSRTLKLKSLGPVWRQISLWTGNDNDNERNAEEILLHYEPIDYSINANKQNEEENPLQSATADPAVPNEFDYANPPAELKFMWRLSVKKLTENLVLFQE